MHLIHILSGTWISRDTDTLATRAITAALSVIIVNFWRNRSNGTFYLSRRASYREFGIFSAICTAGPLIRSSETFLIWKLASENGPFSVTSIKCKMKSKKWSLAHFKYCLRKYSYSDIPITKRQLPIVERYSISRSFCRFSLRHRWKLSLELDHTGSVSVRVCVSFQSRRTAQHSLEALKPFRYRSSAILRVSTKQPASWTQRIRMTNY